MLDAYLKLCGHFNLYDFIMELNLYCKHVLWCFYNMYDELIS